MSKWLGCARERASRADSTGRRAVPIACLILLVSSTFSISGCIGLTSASKPGSGQQSTTTAATISLAPASIRFGSVAIGSTVSQSVTISNGGGSSLTVTHASTAAAGVTISGISLPLVIAAGKQATFNVVFSPKAAGALAGDVSVASDISSSPSIVSLSGIGMAATAFLTTSNSSISFGTVAIGKNSALPVTLTNAGNSKVTVSKVGVSGASYATSGISGGLILGPGQSATLDVSFAPLVAGVLPGTVTVTSNATNSPTTISLSGSGAQAAQAVSHSVQLTWTPSASSVAGYNVYRSEVSGGPYARLDSSAVAADSFLDSSVQGGLTYYYVVTAVTSAGAESADSAQVSAVVPTP